MWSSPFFSMTSPLRRQVPFVPAADVAVSGEDLVLTMDMPGFSSGDLAIEIEDDFLIVRGERRRPQVAEGTSYVHVERPFGAFERRVRVPRGVDADRITASLTDGVLSLIVPKPEQLKPKAITIQTGTGTGTGTTASTEQRGLETAGA